VPAGRKTGTEATSLASLCSFHHGVPNIDLVPDQERRADSWRADFCGEPRLTTRAKGDGLVAVMRGRWPVGRAQSATNQMRPKGAQCEQPRQESSERLRNLGPGLATTGWAILARHVLTIVAVRTLHARRPSIEQRSAGLFASRRPSTSNSSCPTVGVLGSTSARALPGTRRDAAAVPDGAITGTELYFHVDDLDEAVARLTAAGPGCCRP